MTRAHKYIITLNLHSHYYLVSFIVYLIHHEFLFFKHPTTIKISGQTGCGKTWFGRLILKEQLIQPFPNQIVWVYSEWQSDYDNVRATFPHVEFVEG